jgi:beta-lactamase class A
LNCLRALAACLVSSLAVCPVSVRADESTVAKRAVEVAALVAKQPHVPDGLFDSVFLREVPPDRLLPILKDLHTRHGPVLETRLLREEGALQGSFEARFEDGWVTHVDLRLTKEPPHRILYLLFHPPAPGHRTLADAAAEVARLPGQVSFGVYALEDQGPRPLVEARGEEALAVGSAFKLFILGTLAKEIAEGSRTWADTLRLDPRWRSQGSGRMHTWPDGAPLTLHTLATMMISQSDNTATDHLLHHLGRERIEALLTPMGNRVAARNMPLLSTAEMFRLKWIDGGRPGREFMSRDSKGRRAYLEKEAALLSLGDMDTPVNPAPRFLDSVEWFASASDLARLMDWLRRLSESGPAAELRSILAVAPGLSEAKSCFAWAGYKGGSEPGVLNLTFLLRTRTDAWYAVAATWNNPLAPLEEGRLELIVRRVLQLLGAGIEGPGAPEGK